jgi:hypothetical protein
MLVGSSSLLDLLGEGERAKAKWYLEDLATSRIEVWEITEMRKLSPSSILVYRTERVLSSSGRPW